MASPLALMKRGVTHLELNPISRNGLAAAGEATVGVVLDGAVGFGTSYGLGQVYHRYGDKWYGKHAPKILGAAGKIGAVLLSAFGGGVGAGVANAIGQAGVNAIGLEMGLKHARKSTGVRVFILPAAADTKALPAGAREVTSIGGSRALSEAQIEELASMH